MKKKIKIKKAAPDAVRKELVGVEASSGCPVVQIHLQTLYIILSGRALIEQERGDSESKICIIIIEMRI